MTDESAANARLSDHIAECARWRHEVVRQMGDRFGGIESTLGDIRQAMIDLKTLTAETEGRREQNKALLGNIPNAIWSIIIAGAGSAMTVGAVKFLSLINPR